MASTYEKSVKGGTKIKLAAPKSKYVEHILQATDAGEAGIAEIFRTMQHRLRDSTWTIVFKALIITHLMIREGKPNQTLRFLAESPNKLAISNFSDVQVQGPNIRHYYGYLGSRVRAFHDTEIDWVREAKGRLKKQTVDKGLLRETEVVQKQISALLKCDLFAGEQENEITLTAFRLLTMDLLTLYHVGNEGAINVLERYFEMSKPDAERALAIYKTFARQTEQVVKFLGIARQFENATRLEIPKLKHAPTGLTSALEEYLNDPDFEVNRRQFLAQREAKKGGKSSGAAKEPTAEFGKLSVNDSSSKPSTQAKSTQPSALNPVAKGPAPDLIDLFASIEQNQQPMGVQSPPQLTNAQFAPQPQFQQQPFQNLQTQPQAQTYTSTNPFASMVTQQQPQAPIQTSFAGFTGQPQTQNGFGSPTQTNSQLQPTTFQQQPFFGSQPQQISNGAPQQLAQQSFLNGSQQLSPNQAQPFGSPINSGGFQPMATGQVSTNPFRASMMPQPTASSTQSFNTAPSPISLLNQQSTNPFRSMTPQSTQLNNNSPFTSAPPSSTSTFFSMQSPQSIQSPQSVQSMPTAQPLQPMRTGTNPFKSAPSSTLQTPTLSPLAPQRTGTNPFRQSAFVNQQTGQGWTANQGTMGGLEQLDTIPVFPRPTGQP